MTDNKAIPVGEIHSVPIAAIDRSGRLRPIDPAKVQLIADGILTWRAMGNQGIPAPITVRPAGPNAWKLVAGGHRVSAVELLGDLEIPVLIQNLSDLQARLVEIDENLCRNELNALDRAAFLAERSRIWEKMYPDKAGRKGSNKARWHGASDLTDHPTRTVRVGSEDIEKFSFAEDAQEKIGLSASTIRRDVQMYRLLASTPEILDRVRGTGLENNPGQLKALARVPAPERGAVLDLLLGENPPAKNVAGAIAQMRGHREPSASPDELLFKALVNTWERAGARVRGRFLDHLHSKGALDAYTNGSED